ncbi:MAG TPA: hypothetical protein VLD37_06410 [Candidatus Bilamarchaeum sp.]|nr:hypothetical protein [Candidatus Bilamarchaeum sp.]
MKAQASIEFLLVFMLNLASVSLLSISMLSYGSVLEKKLSEISALSAAESGARASEVAYRCMISMEKRADSRIEDRLYLDAGDKVIEVGGVFYADETEPV